MARNEAQQLQAVTGTVQTIKLQYPISLADGEVLDEITVRRVRVGDIRAVARIENEVEQGLAVLQRVTGLMAEDLDMLDAADLEVLQSAFQGGAKLVRAAKS